MTGSKWELKKFKYNGAGYKPGEVMPRSGYDKWGCGWKHVKNGNDFGFQGSGILWWLRSIYENMSCGDIEITKWIVSWAADLLQNPGKRPGTALTCRGGQGVGKGMYIKPISKLVEEHFLHTSRMQDLVGKFNAHLQSLLLVFADEAIYAGDSAGASVLKTLISEESMAVEKKGVDKFRSENFCRVYISSNSAWVVPAEADERRHCVVDAWDGHKQDQEFFRRVNASQYELGELLDELLNLDLKATGVDVSKVPDTEGLRGQKSQNMSLEEEFLLALAQGLESEGGYSGDSDWEEIGNKIIADIMNGYVIRPQIMFDMFTAMFPKHHEIGYATQQCFTSRLSRIMPHEVKYGRMRSQNPKDNSANRGWLFENVGSFLSAVREKISI